MKLDRQHFTSKDQVIFSEFAIGHPHQDVLLDGIYPPVLSCSNAKIPLALHKALRASTVREPHM